MTRQLHISHPTLMRLLRHGFVLPSAQYHGLVVLLRGKAGTGKSTLALQILDQLHPSERRYYCTLEQTEEDLRQKLFGMRISRAMQASLSESSDQRDPGLRCFAYDSEKFEAALKPVSMGPRVKAALALINQKPSDLLGSIGEPTTSQVHKSDEHLTALIEAMKIDAQAQLQISVPEESLGQAQPEPKDIEIVDSKAADAVLPSWEQTSRVLSAPHLLAKPRNDSLSADPTGSFREGRPIVVLDGLSLLSSSEREAIELQVIVEMLRRTFKLSILVYEPSDDLSGSLDHHADMVIELGQRQVHQPIEYLIHEMCITKARYQDSALGRHQFKIRKTGLEFFPSLHFEMHQYNYMHLESKRSEQATPPPRPAAACRGGSLLDLLCCPQEGESIVLLGPRNCFKTHITTDFLGGAPDNEPGFLISLISNSPTAAGSVVCPWCQDSDSQNCSRCENGVVRNSRSFQQRPGFISPAEFFYFISGRIRNLDSKRIVFWDLTQIDYRFPLLKEDKMFIPALMDTFKTKGLKSLFMGAGNAENSKAAAAIADHVLFCWRSEAGWEREESSGSSLMLYVDRTPYRRGALGRAGRQLYCFPIVNDLPRWPTPNDLQDFRATEALGGKKIPGYRDNTLDIERIAAIEHMQSLF